MNEPKIAQKGPFAVEVEAGDFWWCACGRSAGQPFCDGSHKGTGFNPVKVTIPDNKMVYFCGCKHTGNKPFCDGTHRKI